MWSWRYHTAPGVEDHSRFSIPALRQLLFRLEEIESGYDLADRRVDCRMDEVPVDAGEWHEHWYVYFVARKPQHRVSPAPHVERPPNTSLLNYTMPEIKTTYEDLLDDESLADAIAVVLDVKSVISVLRFLVRESGTPLRETIFSTGYHRMMLGRYLFAGSQFCRAASVLDTCSGLGWGPFWLHSMRMMLLG